jgi:hypothetical protein
VGPDSEEIADASREKKKKKQEKKRLRREQAATVAAEADAAKEDAAQDAAEAEEADASREKKRQNKLEKRHRKEQAAKLAAEAEYATPLAAVGDEAAIGLQELAAAALGPVTVLRGAQKDGRLLPFSGRCGLECKLVGCVSGVGCGGVRCCAGVWGVGCGGSGGVGGALPHPTR